MSVNSRLKATKIIGESKAFYRQRILGSSYARKEIADKDILVTSRNGDRKIMQSIRITSRPPSRIRKWNQLSHFRCIPKFLGSGRKSWTLDSGLWTLEVGLWTLDSGRWTLDAGLWTLDPGRWTLDSGHWTLDAELSTLDSGHWTLDWGC